MDKLDWSVVAIVIFCVLNSYNKQVAMCFLVGMIISYITSKGSQTEEAAAESEVKEENKEAITEEKKVDNKD